MEGAEEGRGSEAEEDAENSSSEGTLVDGWMDGSGKETRTTATTRLPVSRTPPHDSRFLWGQGTSPVLVVTPNVTHLMPIHHPPNMKWETRTSCLLGKHDQRNGG